MYFLRTVFTCAAIMASACTAMAQSILTEDRVIQMRLMQEGHLTGKPDGKIGPATRKAMDEFAEANGIENSRAAIISKMVEMPILKPFEITENVKNVVIESVKSDLKDPMSAQVAVDNAFLDGSARIAVCGTVNAKNSYGAFTGKQAFHSTVTALPFVEPFATTLIDDNDASLMCALGTSLSYLLGSE